MSPQSLIYTQLVSPRLSSGLRSTSTILRIVSLPLAIKASLNFWKFLILVRILGKTKKGNAVFLLVGARPCKSHASAGLKFDGFVGRYHAFCNCDALRLMNSRRRSAAGATVILFAESVVYCPLFAPACVHMAEHDSPIFGMC